MNAKQRYAKKYWAREDVKERKMLQQREKYHSEKIQNYESKRRRTAKSRWMRSRYNALKRGKVWEIPLEDFEKLISQPCEYCQASVAEETGSSLDRKDNDVGYLLSNVNTCCRSCNRRRSKSMSADEFKKQTALNKYGK